MAKKTQKCSADDKKLNTQISNTVKDSAQQIWLAGLGAFSKAQEEGGRVFEALVKQGVTIQRNTQTAAEEKIAAVTNRATHMTADIGAKAQGPWDKLENIFEDRVAKALAKLGVPSVRDFETLSARLDALEAQGHQATTDLPKTRAAKTAKQPSPIVPIETKKTAARKKAPAKAAAKPAAKAIAQSTLRKKAVTQKPTKRAA